MPKCKTRVTKRTKKRKTKTSIQNNQTLRRDLVRFCDEFASFKDRCWFLCDAMHNLVTADHLVDDGTADSIRTVTMDIQRQSTALSKQLRKCVIVVCNK